MEIEGNSNANHKLLQQAGLVLGMKILDVGFRDLQELKSLAELVGTQGSVYGIDVDSNHVVSAHEKLGDLPDHFNIMVREGSVLEIPADDNTFDLVLCKGILHEVRDLDRAFIEMSRVCKQEGMISIIDFQHFSRIKFIIYKFLARLKGYQCDDVHPGFTQRQLQELLAQHSLTELHYQPLQEIWQIGFIKAHPFLLKAKLRG